MPSRWGCRWNKKAPQTRGFLIPENHQWSHCVPVGFSSPVILPNSFLERTNAFIMAQGDICSFVHGFVHVERSSEYLAIPRDHYIQIGPSLLIFLSIQNLSLGQLTSKWMSAGR